MRILLIDDEQSLLDILALAFEDEGFDVLVAKDGQEGLLHVINSAPDIIISDVNMPRLDGFSFCRRLREQNNFTPLILLTSRDNDIDEALGLELGADDYVAKPFSTRVLVARVRSLMRRQEARAEPPAPQPERIVSGLVSLDTDRMEVLYKDQPIVVTVTEFRMIEGFLRRAGMVLNRERLMELARGDDSIVADRIVDTYVRRLRRKFEAIDPTFDRIETVIGAGYRWRK